MARKPAHTPRNSVPSIGERLAVIETRLEETLEALPARIEAAIARGMEQVASAGALDALTVRVAALESARAFSAGAVKVEQRTRSELQEWARTLLPYVFTIAAAAVGWRALG